MKPLSPDLITANVFATIPSRGVYLLLVRPMQSAPLAILSLLCGLALTACATSPAIDISVVDRYGTPQPYAQVTANWQHRAPSKEERTVILVNGTDENGRFTIHDTELPDSIEVYSRDTHRSATLHHVKWGENVVVIR